MVRSPLQALCYAIVFNCVSTWIFGCPYMGMNPLFNCARRCGWVSGESISQLQFPRTDGRMWRRKSCFTRLSLRNPLKLFLLVICLYMTWNISPDAGKLDFTSRVVSRLTNLPPPMLLCRRGHSNFNSTLRLESWKRHRTRLAEQLSAYRARVRFDELYLTGNMCVSILTAYPRLPTHEAYVSRLLNQLSTVIPLPLSNMTVDLHLFCEGNCANLTRLTSSNVFSDVHLHLLNATSVEKKERRQTWNYHAMFELLFGNHSLYGGSHHQYCVILEDDLILSPDSLIYLNHGMRLMEQDDGVFTVSLFNDNSLPLYSMDASLFKLASHFAGLGFVMSSKWYIGHVDPLWNSSVTWDVTVQLAVAKKRLSSIIPEVTRSWHIRDEQVVYDGEDISMPRDIFESHNLNRAILPSYDFNHLRHDEYDQYIRSYLETGVRIVNLEDAYFFTNSSKLIFSGCESQKHLGLMLDQKRLFGSGNGKVVRGSYKGVLLMRTYKSQVLIICKDSYFSNINHTYGTAVYNNQTPFISGVHFRLFKDYLLILAEPDVGCDVTCASKSSLCDVRGLAMLSDSCNVIRSLFPQCQKRCFTAVVDPRILQSCTGHLPGMTDSGMCFKGSPHHLSCEAHLKGVQRLCPCLARKFSLVHLSN